ncbi:MAG: ATP-binding cassette domain-containing protein, partial [Oscillospiraceae bacterium]
YSRHAPHNLSGGQKQRVAIAGIIAMNPKCIVLDEPTAMLDPKGRKEVLNTITKLNKSQNTTVVYITHFMDEAIKADRVIVIDNGKILIDGTPKEVFCNVEMLKSIGLDVPQVTELTYELQKEGFNLPSDILTVDDFINSIGKEIKSGNN